MIKEYNYFMENIRNLAFEPGKMKDFLRENRQFRLPAIYDSAFKLLFNNKIYLAKLLTFFIPFNFVDIRDNIVIRDPNIFGDNIFSRSSIGDIVVDIFNYTILIECNISKSKNQNEKNINTFFGLCYTRYNVGSKIDINKKALLLSFDNFDDLKLNKLLYDGKLLDTNYYIPFSENYEIIHINLEYVRNVLYNEIEIALHDGLIKYLCLIVNIHKSIDELLRRDEYMRKANEELNRYLDECCNVIRNVNEAYRRAEAEEAMEIGEKRGEKRGSDNRKKAIAINMLNDNLDDKTIAKYTEYPINKIKKLRENMLTKCS